MGSGYRVFTAGEVLTASNVQDYLQNQSVMSFADSTARATSIGTANFEEGMVSYLQDSDTLEVYDGSTWGSIAPATTQGLTLINTTSFSGVASQSINDVFSATYDNYKIILRITLTGTTGWTSLRFRVSGTDTSAANYSSAYYGISPLFNAGDFGGTAGATTLDLAYSDSTQEHSFSTTDIISPFLTQPTLANGIAAWKHSSNKIVVLNSGGGLDNSTSYTGFTLLMPGGANATGTVSVYGYNK